MIAKQLKLTQFRNYEFETITFHSRVNAFTGLNGMGKTNILDALYYLCLGKSYFSSLDKNVIMQEKDFFRLEGHFVKNEDHPSIVVKNKAGQRKEIEISGKKVDTIADHVGQFLCVIIAPDDVQLILEGSEARRNLLNNTIVQSDKVYLNDLLLYNGLLKRRNALLKSFADQKIWDELLIESVTAPMFAPAQKIYEARQKMVNQLQPIFAEIYADVSGSQEQCSITYQSQVADQSLEYLMYQNMGKDKILGRTSAGIHKDDLVFVMNGQPLRAYASQGQLKSFVLALKIAQYKMLEINTQEKPILLLDDIFDKLDPNRVSQLLKLLVDKEFGQIFITDTDAVRTQQVLDWSGSDYSMFGVRNGQISSI